MNNSEFPSSKKQPNLRYCGLNCIKATEADRKLSCKSTAIAWKVKSRGHVGQISKLHIPKSQVALSQAERWITFGSDTNVLFPYESLKPEVYKRKQVLPKTLPRKVMIERLRVEYAAADINQIIADRGIDPISLIPPDAVRTFMKNDNNYTFDNYVSTLPLEIFDNEDLELMTPEKWMAKGIVNKVQYSLPAIAFVPAPLNNSVAPLPSTSSALSERLSEFNYNLMWNNIRKSYVWTPVAVKGYNQESNTWSVVTLDQYKSVYNLPRIYIYFKAENPKIFEQRLVNALNYRSEIEMELRLQVYVDAMVVVGVPDMPTNMLKKINNFMKCKYIMKSWGRVNEMIKDIVLDYKRCLCEMELRKMALGKFSRFFPAPIKKWECYDKKESNTLVENTFLDMQRASGEYFKWINVFVIINTYNTLEDIVTDGLKAEQMLLFSGMLYKRGISLEDFKNNESEHAKRTVRYLTETWTKTCTASCKTHMLTSETIKSWFEIREARWNIYVVSKLYRFMGLIKYHMENTIYNIVKASVQKFVDSITAPCLLTMRCKKAKNFFWGPDLCNSAFVPPYGINFIFHVTLNIDSTSAYYSTKPDQFLPEVIELFDEAIAKCHFVNRIEPYVLDNLQFPSNLFLSSIGLLDPFIVKAREKLIDSLSSAIIPLKAYLREWNQFVPLYALVITEYVKAIKEENRSSLAIRLEISFHLNERERLLSYLPYEIVIGPFLLKTNALRMHLINKRYDIASKIMDMYASCLHERVIAVNTVYNGIMIKLLEKLQSIEHVLSVKEWIQKIPEIVETQRALLEDILRDYEVLDFFWYCLSEEEFNSKFDAVCYPKKIADQVEITNYTIEDDTDKYFRIQQYDESAMDEKIDTLTAQATGYAQVSDISKIPEIAVEVRRLYKLMNETIAFGKILQRRQALFEIPVNPYTDLFSLVDVFYPYVLLWSTASDVVRGMDGWLFNPVFNLDLAAMYTNIDIFMKAAEESVENFNDLPNVRSVAVYIRDLLADFNPIAVLAKAIRNPNMKEEQWRQVLDLTGIKFEIIPAVTTLNIIKEQKPHRFCEIIMEISNTATREFQLAEALRLKESNERFFKTLLQESIVADLKTTHRKGLVSFVDTIVEDIMTDAEDSMYVMDVCDEIVKRANDITYKNVAKHISDIINELIINKLRFR